MPVPPPSDPDHPAAVVLPCDDLDATVEFFVEQLGFRLDAIEPADAPELATLSTTGLTVRLERGLNADPGMVRLPCLPDGATAESLRAPNGTSIELVARTPPVAVPPLQPELVIARAGDASAWHQGRAGMAYRDLIPSRLGGHSIASHIRVTDEGPVPDHVHHHDVQFQMIFCRRGWVRVVYEDQGAPFVLEAGDAVLQPPNIRHRVLASGAGLEVVELACPARHPTRIDHALALPTPELHPARRFAGQRFSRHHAATAAWKDLPDTGWERRDLGIAAACNGLVDASVDRATAAAPPRPAGRDDDRATFWFVLRGAPTLAVADRPDETLAEDDAAVLPSDRAARWHPNAQPLELLRVVLPA
ncbi:MAG: cupin domain-containing protein [Planctomycetota bacterium]